MSRNNRVLMKILIGLPVLWFGVVPAHARFHMVWLLISNLLLSVSALTLLLKSPAGIPGARIAGILGLCVYAGFFLSLLSADLYGGSLTDPGGVDNVMGIDANLLVFTPLSIMLAAGVYLSFRTPVER